MNSTEDTIINRVANSKLKTFNLEDLYPTGTRHELDIEGWLLEGIVLQENKFREHAKNHDWSQYDNGFLCLNCSADAIVPSWAYMLLMTYASNHARKVVVGDTQLLETILYSEIINQLDVSEYEDLPVIVKGCSNKPVPQNAYLMLIEKLQPIVRSLMFGEACSSVPLYKKKRR